MLYMYADRSQLRRSFPAGVYVRTGKDVAPVVLRPPAQRALQPLAREQRGLRTQPSELRLPTEVVGVPVVREQVGGRHGAVHIVRADVEPAAFTSVRTFRGRQDESGGCCGLHMASFDLRLDPGQAGACHVPRVDVRPEAVRPPAVVLRHLPQLRPARLRDNGGSVGSDFTC